MSPEQHDRKIDALAAAWAAYRRAELGQLNLTADRLREAARAAGWVEFGHDRATGGYTRWAFATLLALGLISADEDLWP